MEKGSTVMWANRIIKMFEKIGMEKTKSPYTEQFAKEIGPAKKAEELVKKKLEEEFGIVLQADTKEIHYDLLIRKTGATVEVKYDKKSKDTGNVAIELEAYGNKRGILRSKSTYYAIVCHNKRWGVCLVPTVKLKELVIEGNHPEVMGGDNNATKLKIVPVKDIMTISVKMYPIAKIVKNDS